MPVVDASVLTASFVVPDPGHAESRRWLATVESATDALHAPTILLSEVAGAVRRITGRERPALVALQTLLDHPALELVPVTEELGRQAAQLAIELGVRGCDAIYIATARALGETLVTLDGEQRERGARVVRTATPGDLAP